MYVYLCFLFCDYEILWIAEQGRLIPFYQCHVCVCSVAGSRICIRIIARATGPWYRWGYQVGMVGRQPRNIYKPW